MSRDILTVQNLKVHFTQKRGIVKALDGVDVFLREGLTTSLAGESGCGKTTLAKTILQFYRPNEGVINFDGKDISLRENERLVRKNIQIVFQNPFASVDPRYTVFKTLNEALSIFKKVKKSEAQAIIIDTLKEVELAPDILHRYPHQLSGGQVQRVCIARAIINRPPLIILDEPTSSLDITTASKIIELLDKLKEHLGITFLFISHNLRVLRKISDYCFIMYYGKIVEYGPKELVYKNPLHPYTKLLIEASYYKLKSIPEPSLSLEGCPFKERCSSRMSECDNSCTRHEPTDGHFVFCHLYK